MRQSLIFLFFATFVQSQSLLFDNRDDFISISPSEEVENMEGITISTWIYKEKNSNYEETLIDFGGKDSKDTPYRYIIKFEGNRIKAWVEGSAFDGTNVSFLTCANCLYEDLPIYDQWIIIDAVYTPNSSKLYFNGMLIGSSIFNLSAESLSIFNNSGNYFIGKNATVKDSYFEGYVDEVAVWSKALSFVDVKNLYENTRSNRFFYSNDLIGFWSMEEGHGNIIRDQGIYHNNGLIIGAEWNNFNRNNNTVELNNFSDSEIALSHYPNPFNSKVTLVYELPNPGLVNVDIYDIMGKKVKSLVNDFHNSGINSVKWNGTNDNNYLVPSGTYFYKVESLGYTKTNKIQFVK